MWILLRRPIDLVGKDTQDVSDNKITTYKLSPRSAVPCYSLADRRHVGLLCKMFSHPAASLWHPSYFGYGGFAFDDMHYLPSTHCYKWINLTNDDASLVIKDAGREGLEVLVSC